MQVNIVAVVVLAAYYGVLVGLSAWSRRRGKKRAANRASFSYGNAHDEALSPGFVRLSLANRNIPLFLGVSSMTATWVGGGYLNGTAEAVFKHGLLSTQVPIGYAISLIFGGLFFSHKMRATRSFTMLDPFQQLYGRWIGLLLCLPALCGELFWSAAVLAALGQATEVIAGLSSSTCIVLSSLIYAMCTCAGGLPAVVNTDAFHLFTAFVGLWLCVPFCMTSKFANTEVTTVDARDEAAQPTLPETVDRFLSFVYGGIPWQVYFQRVLSTATVFEAQMLSYVSAVGCLMFAVPPILIASTSRHSNFTAAGYPGPASLRPQDQASVLPFAIRYLCPGVVSVMGMAAVVGAVMSSADSSALSASTLVTRNVYQSLFKPTASERELVKVLRLAVCLATAIATGTALSVTSVFALWTFSSEMVYVLLFPQLIGLFYMPKWTNSYGSVASFVLGCSIRILCGEPSLGVPAVLRLPLYDKEYGQRFPFRTFCTLVSVASLVLGSMLAKTAFSRGWLRKDFDVCNCFQDDATSPIVPFPNTTCVGVSARPTTFLLECDRTSDIAATAARNLSAPSSAASLVTSPLRPALKCPGSSADDSALLNSPLIEPGASGNLGSITSGDLGVAAEEDLASRSPAVLFNAPVIPSEAESRGTPTTLVSLPRTEDSSAVAFVPAPPETTGDHETGGAALTHGEIGHVVPWSPPFRSPALMTGVSSPTGTSVLGTEAFSPSTVSPSVDNTPLTINVTPASVDEFPSVRSTPIKDVCQTTASIGGTLALGVASKPTTPASGTALATAIQEAAGTAATTTSATVLGETLNSTILRRGDTVESNLHQSGEAKMTSGEPDGQPSSSTATRIAAGPKTAEEPLTRSTRFDVHDDSSATSSTSSSSRILRKKSRSKKDSRRERTKQDKPSRRQ